MICISLSISVFGFVQETVAVKSSCYKQIFNVKNR